VTARKLVQVVFGLSIVVLGSLTWNSRVPNFREELVTNRLAGQLRDVPAGSSIDISGDCERHTKGSGWVLFVLEANLINDNQFRSYFETASEEMGVWVTYDSGLLRLGLGSGPGRPDANRVFPIRWVRQNERATILIGISRNETRVVTNVRDFKVAWPVEFANGWSCEYVQFGDDNNPLSEGAGCKGCDVSLRYAVGDDYQDLVSSFDEVSNITTFNQRRWLGTGLTVVGLLLVFGRIPRNRPKTVSGDKSREI